jgi:hypothetical protein
MMATVVLNLTGLMTGLLQLFLRSNVTTTSFRPRDLPGWDSEKREIRLWGPNDLSFGGHMLQPVSVHRSSSSIGSREDLVGSEKARQTSMESTHSPSFGSPKKLQPTSSSNSGIKFSTLPAIPAATAKPAVNITSPLRHARKQSYSIFPAALDDMTSPMRTAPQPTILVPSSKFNAANIKTDFSTDSKTTVPKIHEPISRPFDSHRDLDSIYLSSGLEPPRPTFSSLDPGSRGHRRDSSMVSSATINIGLRLSHAIESEESLPTMPSIPIRRPNSPNLQLQTRNLGPSPLADLGTTSKSSPLSKEERDSRMKTLPPVPRVVSEARVKSTTQLSPTVYTPNTSPGGRKASPTRMNQSPTNAQIDGASLTVPNQKTKGERTVSKADWI